MFRQRQRIHHLFAVFSFFVFCLIGALALPRPVSAADGLTVEAVQGNISGHRLKMSKGDKVTLVVKSGGTVVPPSKVKYKSSRKKVASVSKKGIIKARKKGSAAITVKYKGASYKIKVKVKTSKITIYNASNGFNLSLNRAEMQPGSFRLKVKYKNKKKVSPSKVSFSSSNASVASVNKNGVVTLKAPGTVTIKAKYKKKTGKCTIRVTGKKASGSKGQASSNAGKTSAGSGNQSGTSTSAGSTGTAGKGSGASSSSGSSSGKASGSSSGNSGGSAGSGNSSSSGTNYVKETKQKYSYKLEFVNRTDLYTGYECVLHVITDNPNQFDDTILGKNAGISFLVDGEIDAGAIPTFDDIKRTEYHKVSDGFMYCFTFDKPGAHTIAVREYYSKSTDYTESGVVYRYYVDTNAKLTFNVLDTDKEQEKFYSKLLRQFKGATDRETLENIAVYLRKNLKYQSYYVDGDGKITRKLYLLANYGPWWVTFKDVTCYITTDIMIDLANRLGYAAKEHDTGMQDHRVALVYFDPSKAGADGFTDFDETCMAFYDACPWGTNNNYNINTFQYLY